MHFKLLPYRLKYLGLALMVPGLLFGWMFSVKNIKPDFLDLPVFAIYSSYTSKTVLGFTQTNLLDEISLLFILGGFFLLIFSKEKNEKQVYNKLRAKSGFMTLFIYALFSTLGTLTFFGLGYLQFLLFIIFTPFVIYLILFRYQLLRLKMSAKETKSKDTNL